jgi:hypothetical protein
MNNIQTISSIELLPNEILFECFKYLNGIDTFYSFDQLNSRFTQLIRSIPLYLDFQNMGKLLFDHFCTKILSNKKIRKNFYSLHLSNKSGSEQIEPFLTLFSYDEFPQLHSLVLIGVNADDVRKLELMLPLICPLHSFTLSDTSVESEKLLSALPTSQLRNLQLPMLSVNLQLMNQFLLLTNLTISKCSTFSICQLLSTITNLKYLKVEDVSRYYDHTKIYFMGGLYRQDPYENFAQDSSINLKHLIMIKFQGSYDELETILKRTPNLTNLTFHINDNNIDQINAKKLEHLIISSLPYLKILKFIIRCRHRSVYDFINYKFEKFQSDFWCKEHHWYTDYLVSNISAYIYTIPYMFNEYKLVPYTEIYYNNLINNIERFQNVTHLTIYLTALTGTCQYYFPHVTSLTLQANYFKFGTSKVTKTDIKYLKMIINLSNVRELDMSCCEPETPALLFELLKDASKLSSLDIHPNVLGIIFDDDKLRKYLNKIITKLNITEKPCGEIDKRCNLKKFCQTFTNLEQLICKLDQQDSFLFLLQNLPKLSYINIFSSSFTRMLNIDSLKELNLSGKYISDYDRHRENLRIWFTTKKH